ncbi:MAG: DUF3090 domain-containing protein [Chloroflexi bacterium]|nr:DUF3090 domain-containing protein [Chloroflexota bacterium]
MSDTPPNSQKLREAGRGLWYTPVIKGNMPRFETDIDPCDHITADAIGNPGQRVFYLQAYQDKRTITVIIEKAQLQSLAIGIEQFLAQISQQNPDLEQASGDYVEQVMRINPPVDPLFRVGEIGLGYDKERDRVVIFAKELLTEDADPESAAQVRFWATRTQLRMLARWGMEVASRGRPICPQCGQPMEPEGHFCPKKNGRLH